MNIKNVVVVGGGVLGSQIAYQSAYKGFHVTTYLRSEASIGRAQPKLDRLYAIYVSELTAAKSDRKNVSRGLVPDFRNTDNVDFDALLSNANEAYQNFKYSLDLTDALKDADLVIETMSENPADKIEFYAKMKDLLPEKTIVVTNSSTLLPSKLAAYTGRPEKYLALHFANNIWKQNTAEIMGHAETSPEAFEEVAEFAAAIGMIPLKLKKEKAGYLLNSMLVPFLLSAQALLAEDVSDVETIDKTWVLATGAPMGPFRILDFVGINTAYNIVVNFPDAADPASTHGKIAKLLKENYLDQGKTGINAGEGFYKYH